MHLTFDWSTTLRRVRGRTSFVPDAVASAGTRCGWKRFPFGDRIYRYGGDALRMFVITSHYRSPSSYTDEAMDAAKTGVERLRNAAFRAGASGGEVLDAGATREAFIEAMEDDLNTPRALAALFDLTRDINRATDAGNTNRARHPSRTS
jgi:cysteinyl-tRNA synthetase